MCLILITYGPSWSVLSFVDMACAARAGGICELDWFFFQTTAGTRQDTQDEGLKPHDRRVSFFLSEQVA